MKLTLKRLEAWSEEHPGHDVRLTGAGFAQTGYISAQHTHHPSGRQETTLRVCYTGRGRRNYSTIFARHLDPNGGAMRLEIKGDNGRYLPAWEVLR